VAHFCEGTPLILVGTKTDLRRDEQTRRMLGAQGQTPVTPEHGASVAKEIGARYIECSAKTGSGVQEVFALAMKESMKVKWGKKLKPNRCVVMSICIVFVSGTHNSNIIIHCFILLFRGCDRLCMMQFDMRQVTNIGTWPE